MKIYHNHGSFGSESFDVDNLNRKELLIIQAALNDYYRKFKNDKDNQVQFITARVMYSDLASYLKKNS